MKDEIIMELRPIKQRCKNPLVSAMQLIMAVSCTVLCNSAFALQALNDDNMAEISGEGVAFVMDDLRMQFNGTDDAAGTGYTRLIPVGPLSSTVLDYNATPNTIDVGKGDLYLYGLAISGNDNNVSTQISNNTVDIGTYANPWLIAVRTESVPNFSGVSKSLSQLNIEAPLQTNLVDSAGTLLATDPNSYDIKLGLWADAFVRDPSKVENSTATSDQFWLNSIGAIGHRNINGGADATGGTTLRENRLRLQTVVNGVSLSGTQLKVFQTLDGADTASGLGAAYSNYNNTLGLAMTARINSGASTTLRGPTFTEGATISDNTISTDGTLAAGTLTNYALLHGGWTINRSTLQAATGAAVTGGVGSCNNGGSVSVGNGYNDMGCQYMVQSRSRTDSKTRTVTKNGTWSASPSNLSAHVLRLSTQETSVSANANALLSTPAINGGNAPTFAANEGMFLYNPNINLVIGSQWQPLVLGVAADGKNLVMELTRIPNVANVYKQIYADYTGADATYKGGTCTIYWCGGDGNGISKNATHSSITIGSTKYTAPIANGKQLQVTAYAEADSVGVSFGDLMAAQNTTTTATGSNTTYKTSTEARYIKRVNDTSTTWDYKCYGNTCVIDTRKGTAYQWAYAGTIRGGLTGVTDPNTAAFADRYSYPTVNGNGNNWVDNATSGPCGDEDCLFYGAVNNRNWVVNGAGTAATIGSTTLSFSTTDDLALNNWLQRQGSTATTSIDLTSSATLGNQALNPLMPKLLPLNAVNLGSAVIDGLLIQHLKITTKGL